MTHEKLGEFRNFSLNRISHVTRYQGWFLNLASYPKYIKPFQSLFQDSKSLNPARVGECRREGDDMGSSSSTLLRTGTDSVRLKTTCDLTAGKIESLVWYNNGNGQYTLQVYGRWKVCEPPLKSLSNNHSDSLHEHLDRSIVSELYKFSFAMSRLRCTMS